MEGRKDELAIANQARGDERSLLRMKLQTRSTMMMMVNVARFQLQLSRARHRCPYCPPPLRAFTVVAPPRKRLSTTTIGRWTGMTDHQSFICV